MSAEVQCVPHALFLGLQVLIVIFVRCNLNGHVLHYFQSVCFEPYTLHRVVGHQAHLMHSEFAQHLCAAPVVALIGLKAKMNVGIHGIISLFL